MNLQELLSKTDFLTSIAQYVGLETLTYFTSISKELRQVLDRAEKVDGALSSAIRSMVCADVFSQAIERVENIRNHWCFGQSVSDLQKRGHGAQQRSPPTSELRLGTWNATRCRTEIIIFQFAVNGVYVHRE